MAHGRVIFHAVAPEKWWLHKYRLLSIYSNLEVYWTRGRHTSRPLELGEGSTIQIRTEPFGMIWQCISLRSYCCVACWCLSMDPGLLESESTRWFTEVNGNFCEPILCHFALKYVLSIAVFSVSPNGSQFSGRASRIRGKDREDWYRFQANQQHPRASGGYERAGTKIAFKHVNPWNVSCSRMDEDCISPSLRPPFQRTSRNRAPGTGIQGDVSIAFVRIAETVLRLGLRLVAHIQHKMLKLGVWNVQQRAELLHREVMMQSKNIACKWLDSGAVTGAIAMGERSPVPR